MLKSKYLDEYYLYTKEGRQDYTYFISANHQVLFVLTPNNRRISKTTTNLKFHIIKSNENDKYVK